MNCAFCSDSVSYEKEQPLEEIEKVIDVLNDAGVGEIQITGGEPLLYPRLLEVLISLKNHGWRVVLSTNGTLLEEKKEILPYIDEIILPLDSFQKETLEIMGRGENQFLQIVKNIVFLQEYPHIQIDISTVLTSLNVKEIDDLSKTLQLLPFEKWQIHQFLPQGMGKRNIQTFLLDDRIFTKAIDQLVESEIYEKIIPVPVSKKIQTDWTITPSLNLIRLKDEEIELYGEILKIPVKDLEILFEYPKIYRKQFSMRTNQN